MIEMNRTQGMGVCRGTTVMGWEMEKFSLKWMSRDDYVLEALIMDTHNIIKQNSSTLCLCVWKRRPSVTGRKL